MFRDAELTYRVYKDACRACVCLGFELVLGFMEADFQFEFKSSLMIAIIKPNGVSHFYQLDLPISNFRVNRWYFSFLFKF